MLVCPECFHEWIFEENSENEENVVKEVNPYWLVKLICPTFLGQYKMYRKIILNQ